MNVKEKVFYFKKGDFLEADSPIFEFVLDEVMELGCDFGWLIKDDFEVKVIIWKK